MLLKDPIFSSGSHCKETYSFHRDITVQKVI